MVRGSIPVSVSSDLVLIDVLYEWLRIESDCCYAGLEGDHWGNVGLYVGEAGAKKSSRLK